MFLSQNTIASIWIAFQKVIIWLCAIPEVVVVVFALTLLWLIAAGRYAEDVICDALRKASDLRPKRAPITKGQQAAWENLVKEFG